MNFPWPDLAQMCARSRKSNVSGLPWPRAALSSKTSKFEQTHLFAVQREVESAESGLQVLLRPYCIRLVLEGRDDAIGKPDHNHLIPSATSPPLVSPQVEHVMEVDVGWQG